MKKFIANLLLMIQILLLISLACLLSSWNTEIDLRPFAIVMPITAIMILSIYKRIKKIPKCAVWLFAITMSVCGVWFSLQENQDALRVIVLSTVWLMVVTELCSIAVRDLPISRLSRRIKKVLKKSLDKLKEVKLTIHDQVSTLQKNVRHLEKNQNLLPVHPGTRVQFK